MAPVTTQKPVLSNEEILHDAIEGKRKGMKTSWSIDDEAYKELSRLSISTIEEGRRITNVGFTIWILSRIDPRPNQVIHTDDVLRQEEAGATMEEYTKWDKGLLYDKSIAEVTLFGR